jgi:LmbE family N-acetylglucosaminyl deacetylase
VSGLAAPERRRTLLGVWAHPDDEAYLSAGLMHELRRRGDRVVVVTATSGEHGTSDPVQWPPQRLGAARRRELRESLAVLGVSELIVLGIEDGRCAHTDATASIGSLMRTVRPDVIVTFGPDGMTGHPDHRVVSRWTTDAWRASCPGADLWYATVTPAWHRRWQATNERIGLWDGEVPWTPADRLAHAVHVSGAALDVKLAALRAHHSQTSVLEDMVGAADYREWWRTESFRAAPRVPVAMRPALEAAA